MVFSKPKNRFQEYVNTHTIAKKFKNKTILATHINTLRKAALACTSNSRHLDLPDDLPLEFQPALEEAVGFSRQAKEDVAMMTLNFIAAWDKLPATRNTTNL